VGLLIPNDLAAVVTEIVRESLATVRASATKPRLEPALSEDRFKLAFWIGRYEGYLFLNATLATCERYSRVLTKFAPPLLQQKVHVLFFAPRFRGLQKGQTEGRCLSFHGGH
jgi:hypothetical protein